MITGLKETDLKKIIEDEIVKVKSLNMKWSITIDCHDDGSLDVWTQEKAEKGSLTPTDRQRMNETLSAVKKIVREKNCEIIQKLPQENED